MLLTSHLANAGLINDIATESVSYPTTSGPFSWQTSYDISFVDQNLLIDVDVFLTGVTPTDDLKGIWKSGIESIWGNTFDIFDGTYLYDTLFNVDWLTTSTGADHTVEVHAGDGFIDLENWYTGSPSHWGYHNQDLVAAHEFGHMIGLYDEYATGALDPVTNLVRDDSIMGANLASPQTNHFDSFMDWLSLNSSNPNLLLVQDSGDHFYSQSIAVPAPSTIAIFALSLIGLALRRTKN